MIELCELRRPLQVREKNIQTNIEDTIEYWI